MKHFIIITLFPLSIASVFAQKLNPEVKAGTVLYYNAYMKNTGVDVELQLTFKTMDDPIKMHWEVPGYGIGEWELLQEAVTSARKTTLTPPEPDQLTKIKKNESLLVLSKAVYADAVKNNSFELNGIKFNVIADTAVYRINNKPMASFHAFSDNKKSEIWILNNPNFPLLLFGKNVTKGVDFYLTDVKQK